MTPNDKDKTLGSSGSFISSDSPSVARSKKEWDNPAPTADPEFVAALCRHVELEFGAIAALTVACQKVSGNAEWQDEIAERRKRVTRVAAVIADIGAIAPTADEADLSLVPKSKTDLEYVSDEAAIGEALAANRALVNTSFNELLSSAACEPHRAKLVRDPE